jgi:hypothetical protein
MTPRGCFFGALAAKIISICVNVRTYVTKLFGIRKCNMPAAVLVMITYISLNIHHKTVEGCY